MDAAYFQTFARYNAWANGRLYDACAQLPAEEYLKPRPAFFGSIHNTLNHVLVGDRVWLGRLENRPSGISALNQVLYEDFASLRAARAAEDAHIVALVDGIDDAALAKTLEYRNMSGQPQRTRLDWILAHFFNHQTHHRGQVHDMLSQVPASPPELDLIYFLRQANPG
jgi:uncharacterized damage-inducible protein DinB